MYNIELIVYNRRIIFFTKKFVKMLMLFRKGLETKHFKMAKESGKGANSYKLGENATKV